LYASPPASLTASPRGSRADLLENKDVLAMEVTPFQLSGFGASRRFFCETHKKPRASAQSLSKTVRRRLVEIELALRSLAKM
ncbi:MAG: hypothetical protein ABI557_20655, partial [Aureliella sp.]